MSQWIEQASATSVNMGPFLDEDDGKATEEALAIAQADIRISKNGGAFAQSNNAAGAAHDENGYYIVPLDATDTNTLGSLRVSIHEAGALPVWQDFMIVPTNVWDSMFGADKLQVHTAEITAGLVTAPIEIGTAQAGGASTITLAAGASATNNLYRGSRVVTTGGTGAGQSRAILSYDGGTKIAGIVPDWATNPAGDTTYEIQAADARVGMFRDQAAFTGAVSNRVEVDVHDISDDETAANNLESACDNYSATRGLTGTALPAAAADGVGGVPISDAGGLDIDTQLANPVLSAAETESECNDALVALKLDHLLAVADGDDVADNSVIGQMASTDGDWSNFAKATDSLQASKDAMDAAHALLATPAQVNSQVSDVMKTDQIAQRGQVLPPSTPTFEEAIMYLYQYFRNKRTESTTEIKMMAEDEATVIAKSTISDAAAVFTKGEFASGP